MKKKLLIIPILLLMPLLYASPVLADDPPDTEVDIVVVTPGNLDVDMELDSGGDVDITIDGVDFQDTAQTAASAYAGMFNMSNMLAGGAMSSVDWWRYYHRYLEPQLEGMGNAIGYNNQNLNLVADAVSSLVKQGNLTNTELSDIGNTLVSLGRQIELEAERRDAQDSITWNQLMYGAEYHLSLLDNDFQNLKSALDVRKDNTDESLRVAHSNNKALYEYVTKIQADNHRMETQYTYYFLATGVIFAVLIALIIWLAVAKQRKGVL